MRDTMVHRGPDGAGLWWSPGGGVVLAHRRLAVIDPTEAGRQPMVTPDGRCAIVYNGELYNDAELRRDLEREGVRFRTSCDTETMLRLLERWGAPGLERARGMYALGFWDGRTLLLARDPLGIKPLYYTVGPASGGVEVGAGRVGNPTHLVFASEIPAILAHPGVEPRPNLRVISAYLTTIRTVLGSETLFDGVFTLRPGERVLVDLADERLGIRRRHAPSLLFQSEEGRATDSAGTAAESQVHGTHNSTDFAEPKSVARDARAVLADSVRRHLRSDVPICCLLSGGLDSSAIALLAGEAVGELWTYCAGAREAGRRPAPLSETAPLSDTVQGPAPLAEGEDFAFARLVAEHLGTRHTEVPVTREMFASRWAEMVERMGVPLSTPNEVAINEVARAMRADGKVVTLSGEGADELLAGYELPMRLAAQHVAAGDEDPGLFQLTSNAWIPLEAKPAVLNPDVWRALEQDAALITFYREEFKRVREEDAQIAGGPDDQTPDPAIRQSGNPALSSHLRFHRRINLAGLLQRLDSATMLESVEGRTPFADAAVAAWAESLPMDLKYGGAGSQPARPPVSGGEGRGSQPAAPGGDAPSTKLPLRRALAGRLPPEVIDRPKASFPLPFQEWVADSAGVLEDSAFARELFTPAAIARVRGDPARVWSLAWPMINIALWGRKWWG